MSNLSYLKEYATFNNTKEFNEATAEHLARITYDINETDRDIFMLLSRYAVKYNGVAHFKASTIAKSIGKSVITVRRSIKKLVKLSVIKKQPFICRVTGGNGANIFVFLSSNIKEISYDDKTNMITRNEVEEVEQPKDKIENIEKEPITFISIKEKEYYTYSSNRPYIKNTPYNQFKESIKTFIGESNTDMKLIYRLYGVYLAQTKQLQDAYKDTDTLINIAIKSIQVTFTATKRKELRNIAGYFNCVISNMLDDLCTFEMSQIQA